MGSASEALAMMLALLLSEGLWDRPDITTPRTKFFPKNLSFPPGLSSSQDQVPPSI